MTNDAQSTDSDNESEEIGSLSEEETEPKITPSRAETLTDLLNDRLAVFDRVIRFRNFLPSSFEPTITDAEIIVCFADLRGFTAYCRQLQMEMQDRKIQHFLKRYPRTFAEGLLQHIVGLTDIRSEFVDPDIDQIADYLTPTLYKNLGDGMMMVWEVPASLKMEQQGLLANNIVSAIEMMHRRFLYHFRNLTPVEQDSYSDAVLGLDLGFGIAKGHAWRLDYGSQIDYAGSVINLAARLQDLARPAGLVCQVDVAAWLLEGRAHEGKGALLDSAVLRDYPGRVRIWCAPTVDVEAVRRRAAQGDL